MRTSCVTFVCMCTCVCVHASACVCACVRTCVINENKHPFKSFRYLINYKALINPSNHRYFCHVGLFFYFYAQEMWQHVEHPIVLFNHDRRLSLK